MTTLGVERDFASAPTLDTERKKIFSYGGSWAPNKISIFGHTVSVDITTGNLTISTSDIAYPYYQFRLAIGRKYDLQEQHMQITYLRNYTNVDPKPHWFGNWQFEYEADTDDAWHITRGEIQINSGLGIGGLFSLSLPDFQRNLKSGATTEDLLKTYGVPGRSLSDLDWVFSENDFLLCTNRGNFQILTGHFFSENLVDDIEADMWLFSPMNGIGYLISSRYFYNMSENIYRDKGYLLLITKLVDALGHFIELEPTGANPPFQEFALSDGSGRQFTLELNQELTFCDGLNPGGLVRKYLVSKVIDDTKANYNEYTYNYDGNNLLTKVVYPSSIGESLNPPQLRAITYHYDDPNYPQVLTSIENSFGDKIQFEYLEDIFDLDERLNPRLKVKKITDPEGIVFEYQYDTLNSQVEITISQNGNVDRQIKYTYIRDIMNTKTRYITNTEVDVSRGYLLDPNGKIIPRTVNNQHKVISKTEYSQDGRFNVEKLIDPLGRKIEYSYNNFNQIESILDFDKHKTRNTYDIPLNPSPTQPIRYDLLKIEKENIVLIPIRTRSGFINKVKYLTTTFTYDNYDSNNSPDNGDSVQSTHRKITKTDKEGNQWTYQYDDKNNNNPLNPTLAQSPLGFKTQTTYDMVGNILTAVDAENNEKIYSYTNQGLLSTYTDPNGNTVTLDYYEEDNWLKEFTDQLGKVWQFDMDVEGKVITQIDPVQSIIDYAYLKNGRLKQIITHRRPVPQDPANPNSPSVVTPYANLVSEFGYTPLGIVCNFTNAKGLKLVFEYDEMGRIYEWHPQRRGAKNTKFVYDDAGQLTHLMDRNGSLTSYTYYNSGFIQSIQYPDWNDGNQQVSGKMINFLRYDYLGKVLAEQDSEIGTTLFAYDLRGNLIFRKGPCGQPFIFKYDADNRLLNVHDLSNTYKLSLSLDVLGRTKVLTDSQILDGKIDWNYTYQKNTGGSIKRLNLYNLQAPLIGFETNFDYNERDQTKLIQHDWVGNPVNQVYSQNYEYTDDGLVNQISGDDSNVFRYDDLKQLIYEDNGSFVSDYDQAKNRLFRADLNSNPNPQDNLYNAINEITKDVDTTTQFSYDQNGNVLETKDVNNDIQLYYDGMGYLRVVRFDKSEVRYYYKRDGTLARRIKNDTSTKSKVRFDFQYFQTNPVIITQNGKLYKLLTWDANGRLLRIRSKQAIGGTNYPNSLFALQDTFDNIVRLVDDDQNIVTELTYDPWGNIIDTAGTNITEFWGYKSLFTDPDTNLIKSGIRWYNSEIGRFISEDRLPSIASPTTFASLSSDLENLFCYAGNDPVNRGDPTGLDEIGFEDLWNGVIDDMADHASKFTDGSDSNSMFGLSLDLSSNNSPIPNLNVDTIGASSSSLTTLSEMDIKAIYEEIEKIADGDASTIEKIRQINDLIDETNKMMETRERNLKLGSPEIIKVEPIPEMDFDISAE